MVPEWLSPGRRTVRSAYRGLERTMFAAIERRIVEPQPAGHRERRHERRTDDDTNDANPEAADRTDRSDARCTRLSQRHARIRSVDLREPRREERHHRAAFLPATEAEELVPLQLGRIGQQAGFPRLLSEGRHGVLRVPPLRRDGQRRLVRVLYGFRSCWSLRPGSTPMRARTVRS